MARALRYHAFFECDVCARIPSGLGAERVKRLIEQHQQLSDSERAFEDEIAMLETDAEAESIIDAIRVAFRNVPKGPLSLRQAILKTWADENRVVEARSHGSHSHWKDIANNDIESSGKALYGADPQSWRFFIPAFMIWSLRFFKVNDAFLSDQIIYTFDPTGEKPTLGVSESERFESLSLPQKRTVRRFLEYMANNDKYADATCAQKALDQ
jgi:hypothetical protein